MASSIGFSGQASLQCTRQALYMRPSTKKHDYVEMKSVQWILLTKRKVEMKPREDRRLDVVVMSTSNSSISIYPSPSDTIKQFYKYINEKDLKKLAKFISSDCFFEDLSFFKPFQGRKEVLQFYEQLITSMGENIEFIVGEVCEGNNTAGVNWHMEWKKNRIPFTRGCSFYELTREGNGLVIRKAQVVIESPLKPGPLVLGLLKIVTSLFDAFPEATEWCLRSPHVILQLLLRIYNIVLGPFINPILAFYTNFGNFIARLLSFTLKLIFHISKLFRTRQG